MKVDIRSFRDLRVWQLGVELVEHIYKTTEAFPNYELYGSTNQIRRSAISIPSNIAEGHGSSYTKEFLKFISIALGSLAELETQIEIARRLKYLDQATWKTMNEKVISLGKQLHVLQYSLKKKSP